MHTADAEQVTRGRHRPSRQLVRRLIAAIRENDEHQVEEAVLQLVSRRRIFAPLALAGGAFVMLFSGLRLLVTNWRLMLVQALPAASRSCPTKTSRLSSTRPECPSQTTDAIVAENASARIDGLRSSLSLLAVIALIVLFATRRLPAKQPSASPESKPQPDHQSGPADNYAGSYRPLQGLNC